MWKFVWFLGPLARFNLYDLCGHFEYYKPIIDCHFLSVWFLVEEPPRLGPELFLDLPSIAVKFPSGIERIIFKSVNRQVNGWLLGSFSSSCTSIRVVSSSTWSFFSVQTKPNGVWFSFELVKLNIVLFVLVLISKKSTLFGLFWFVVHKNQPCLVSFSF